MYVRYKCFNCKALLSRDEIYLEHIIPLALKMLGIEPRTFRYLEIYYLHMHDEKNMKPYGKSCGCKAYKDVADEKTIAAAKKALKAQTK